MYACFLVLHECDLFVPLYFPFPCLEVSGHLNRRIHHLWIDFEQSIVPRSPLFSWRSFRTPFPESPSRIPGGTEISHFVLISNAVSFCDVLVPRDVWLGFQTERET